MSEMLGNLHLLSLRVDQAIPCFEELVQRDPQDVRAAHKLAVAHGLQGEGALALAWINEAFRRLAETPPHPRQADDDASFWDALSEAIHTHRPALGAWRFGVGLAMVKAIDSTAFALRLLESMPEQDADPREVAEMTEALTVWMRRAQTGWQSRGQSVKAAGSGGHRPGRVTRLAIFAAFLGAGVALGLTGCGSDEDDPTGPVSRGSCIECHTDQDRLMATADPEEEPEPGESGEG